MARIAVIMVVVVTIRSMRGLMRAIVGGFGIVLVFHRLVFHGGD